MIVNGKKRDIPDGTSLVDFLEQDNYKIGQIAVELNEEIIKKDRYAEIVLHSDDMLEVLTFMGGGQ